MHFVPLSCSESSSTCLIRGRFTGELDVLPVMWFRVTSFLHKCVHPSNSPSNPEWSPHIWPGQKIIGSNLELQNDHDQSHLSDRMPQIESSTCSNRLRSINLDYCVSQLLLCNRLSLTNGISEYLYSQMKLYAMEHFWSLLGPHVSRVRCEFQCCVSKAHSQCCVYL